MPILGSGYPFNATTGVDNNGDGNTSDRPFVNGQVVPRDWGVGTPIYNIGSALQKNFKIKERTSLNLRAEVFNLLNYQNIYSRNGTYGNAANPSATFGAEWAASPTSVRQGRCSSWRSSCSKYSLHP